MPQCNENAFMCRCREEGDHEGPHKCPCGAEWNGRLDTTSFEPIVFPSVHPIARLEFDNPNW